MRSYPDPHLLNADLHCHSNVSDGKLSPAELARVAHENGVRVWALTDHDEIGGIAQAACAAKALGLHFIAGVEISVTWANETLHIVGLNVSPDDNSLLHGLASVRAGREARAREMSGQLALAGIEGAYEGAMKYVGNPDLISRTHFARFLVSQGCCADVSEVFQKYLTPGKPGYVPHQWATLTQAVGWIKAAGGQAVIAHPGRYRLTDLMMHALLEEFKELGGEGIEVVTGSHTVDQYARFAKVSLSYGFKASRGSDFHGPGESRVALGALPALPDGCVPIWHDWNME
ncbi:MAG: PHP domain-containing protein [Burkholderiales bacterium]|nr:PHP domain-containing protein [Burkholderiales bacterium]